MDIGSLFLILALFVLVLLFIGRPLFERYNDKSETDEPQAASKDLSALLAERDRTLTTIQELDFDHTLGKVSEEDYPQLRSEWLKHGADVLRQMDELQPQAAQAVGKSEPSSLDPAVDKVEDRLEAAIALRRAAKVGASPRPNGHGAAPDDQIEVMIANRRRARSEKSGGFCHKCGGPLQKSDRFCPRCGTAIPQR